MESGSKMQAARLEVLQDGAVKRISGEDPAHFFKGLIRPLREEANLGGIGLLELEHVRRVLPPVQWFAR